MSAPSPEICLDSNVFIQLLSPDEKSDAIGDFFATIMARQYFLYAPSLIQFEIAKALRKKEKLKIFAADVADRGIEHFFALPVTLVWNKNLIHKAIALNRRGLKSLYDAAFLALAMDRSIPLVTEDREILAQGRKIYPHVLAVKEWLRVNRD